MTINNPLWPLKRYMRIERESRKREDKKRRDKDNERRREYGERRRKEGGGGYLGRHDFASWLKVAILSYKRIECLLFRVVFKKRSSLFP